MSFKHLKIAVTPLRLIALIILLATITIILAFTSLTSETGLILYFLTVALWFGYCYGKGASYEKENK
jgi:hypothetical protein